MRFTQYLWFNISMFVKEVLLHMTGCAMNEDGSNHQLRYRDYFKADNLTFEALFVLKIALIFNTPFTAIQN